MTQQTLDFMRNEIAPLREVTPNVPVTTNMMGTYPGLDYWKLAPDLDVISWDSYPFWHTDAMKTWELGANVSFLHDINRSLKAASRSCSWRAHPARRTGQRSTR